MSRIIETLTTSKLASGYAGRCWRLGTSQRPTQTMDFFQHSYFKLNVLSCLTRFMLHALHNVYSFMLHGKLFWCIASGTEDTILLCLGWSGEWQSVPFFGMGCWLSVSASLPLDRPPPPLFCSCFHPVDNLVDLLQ